MRSDDRLQGRPACILACDMGGTFLKAACVSPTGERFGEIRQTPSRSGDVREAILSSLSAAFSELFRDVEGTDAVPIGIGISTPGPFDFENGCSLMTQKFQAIYQVPLAQHLRESLHLSETFPVRFIQDANAFLLGEHFLGAAQGADRCAGITLGTGLGFTVLVDGKILTNGFGSPCIPLYRQPYRGGHLEDAVSARGICLAYLKMAGLPAETPVTAKEVGQLAKAGDRAAVGVMESLGTVLGENIAYLLNHFRTQRLILGGQISKDFKLFGPALQNALRSVPSLEAAVPAAHPEEAALYGVAALYT